MAGDPEDPGYVGVARQPIGRSRQGYVDQIHKDTSVAADDLQQATYQARKKILEWGEIDRLGQIALGGSTQTFPREELGADREYSEATAQKVGRGISELLEEAFWRARDILGESSFVNIKKDHEQSFSTIQPFYPFHSRHRSA